MYFHNLPRPSFVLSETYAYVWHNSGLNLPKHKGSLSATSDQIFFHSQIYDFDNCTCGATF